MGNGYHDESDRDEPPSEDEATAAFGSLRSTSDTDNATWSFQTQHQPESPQLLHDDPSLLLERQMQLQSQQHNTATGSSHKTLLATDAGHSEEQNYANKTISSNFKSPSGETAIITSSASSCTSKMLKPNESSLGDCSASGALLWEPGGLEQDVLSLEAGAVAKPSCPNSASPTPSSDSKLELPRSHSRREYNENKQQHKPRFDGLLHRQGNLLLKMQSETKTAAAVTTKRDPAKKIEAKIFIRKTFFL